MPSRGKPRSVERTLAPRCSTYNRLQQLICLVLKICTLLRIIRVALRQLLSHNESHVVVRSQRVCRRLPVLLQHGVSPFLAAEIFSAVGIHSSRTFRICDVCGNALAPSLGVLLV